MKYNLNISTEIPTQKLQLRLQIQNATHNWSCYVGSIEHTNKDISVSHRRLNSLTFHRRWFRNTLTISNPCYLIADEMRYDIPNIIQVPHRHAALVDFLVADVYTVSLLLGNNQIYEKFLLFKYKPNIFSTLARPEPPRNRNDTEISEDFTFEPIHITATGTNENTVPMTTNL